MCGRFTLSVQPDELGAYLSNQFNINNYELDYHLPRYNVAPSQNVIAVLNDGSRNRVGLLRWGYIPKWADNKKIGFTLINAKGETLDQKSMFKEAYKKQRCVIISDGFFEWKKEEKHKLPLRIILKNRSLFAFAGLWSTYIKKDGTKIHTCTIVTTSANELISSVHNRMPVILDSEALKIWLNPLITDFNILNKVLLPYKSNEMEMYEVPTAVNSPRYDEPDCIKNLNVYS